MKSRVWAVVFLVAAACSSLLVPRAASAESHAPIPQPGSASAGGAADVREGIRAMVTGARDRVFPALVNIRVVTVSFWGGKETKGQSTGSGTIISPEGHVLTNAHVTNNGLRFRLTLADKREVSAVMVGEDPLTDLAVLKIDPSFLAQSADPLPVAQFGDSDELMVGDLVMAMGSPFSLSRSVTLGIVSNTERVFSGITGEVEDLEFEGDQRTGVFTRWIQHDALINPGNSGGPLVNLRGQLVGVNTRGGTGMGFASPSNLARQIADALIEHGEVPRSWFGVTLRQIQRTGIEDGVLVTGVLNNSPAARAGLAAGDVITSMNAEPVTVRFAEQIPPLLKKMSEFPIGGEVEINYRRDGEARRATVTTERMLRERGRQTTLRGWGLNLQEITPYMARERQLETTQGASISGVRSGGAGDLAEPKLAWGDIMTALDGQPVRTIEDAVAIYDRVMAMETPSEFLLVEFDRQGKRQVTLIKPKSPRRDDPPREVPKAWLGVATQPVLRELSKFLGHPDLTGFRITRVYPSTLAAQADLRAGDLITAINGERLAPRGMQEAGMLNRLIRGLNIDDSATVTVVREGRSLDVPVRLERTRIGPEEARRDENRDWELTVRELTFFDRDDNRWSESVQGVLVDRVERAGWAGLAGLTPGDLIVSIDGAPVPDLAAYRATMDALAVSQPARVVFVTLRWSRTQFKFAEPEWKPIEPGITDPTPAPADR
ncbi:MAG: PDZ domain-containing protein [Phycisphaeraceae bacterium]|nr:PDZ domain-containing protein [Phycisphaerae bacterium]MBX3391410.1 PDZ domain-containing protein [Phycisphaeraceae bacterium]